MNLHSSFQIENSLPKMTEVRISFPEDDDIPWITQNSNIMKPFHSVNIKKLFETATWSLIVKQDDQPRAYAAFQSHPNMHYDVRKWEQQIQKDTDKVTFEGISALFLRYFICEPDKEDYLKLVLKKTFHSLPFIKDCCFLAQITDEVDEILVKTFTQAIDLESDLRIWNCQRDSIVTQVGIRSKKSEDYLSLKNLFSQMYSFSNSELQNLTMDFLDFGEDRCPTYKYFTFDEDNTYIGVADKKKGEAVGFICATTQHVDLDFLNQNFQLDAVYGLRKKHPEDSPELSFGEDSPKLSPEQSSSETSDEDIPENLDDEVKHTLTDILDEVESKSKKLSPEQTSSETSGENTSDNIDDDVIHTLTNILDEVETKSEILQPEKSTNETSDEYVYDNIDDDVIHTLTYVLDEVESKSEIIECLRDIFDEIFPKLENTEFSSKENSQVPVNYENLDLTNPDHLSFIKQGALESAILVNLVNSSSFDTQNDQHIELIPLLENDILQIETERLEQILNSEAFNPSEEIYAKVSLLVMDKMPYRKLQQFKKSSIGARICEDIKLKQASSKKRSNIKLSFADMQVLLRQAAESSRYENITSGEKPLKASDSHSESEFKFKNIRYGNMGFISGLAVRGTYKIQENYSLSKIKEPFGYSSKEDVSKKEDSLEKYPIQSVGSETGLKINIPIYHGDTNCTFIEQLAVEKEYESGSLFLVMAAFEYFPRVDYGILLLPYGTKQVPLLRQFFTQIPARPFSIYDKELFVFHRSGFNEAFKVRRYENNDLHGVLNLIKCSCLKDYLLSDLELCLSENDKQVDAITLLSGDQIFGIAVISDILEMEFIRKNYDIGDRVNIRYHKYKSGELLHCVLHPIAKFIAKDFLKEAMRLTGKSIFYYKIFPTHIVPYNPSFWQSLCNILEELMPLRLTQTPPLKLTIALHQVEEKSSNTQNNIYSLCYTCTKWVLRDKSVISSRIVVLGSSDIAIGVLESLIYSYKYRFTNLAIISKNCIPSEFPLNEKCYKFIPQRSDYTQRNLDSLCIPAWVTTIKGGITSIEHNFLQIKYIKENKSSNFQVGFDVLVICEELEYRAEKVERSDTPKENAYRKKYSMLKNLWEHNFITVRNPSNVFSLNCAEDGAKVLNWLWKHFGSKGNSKENTPTSEKNGIQGDKITDRIIIHGNCVNTYVCVAILLEENFPTSKTTFVKTNSRGKSSSFYTHDIKEAIDHILRQSDLEIYEGSLQYKVDDDKIAFVDVTTEENIFRLDCCSLILFNTKNINYDVFKVLHQSSLSFTLPIENSNGYPYLLINAEFQTNIKNIFAAGSITEMHTKVSPSIRLENCFYNPKEIGLMIGENIVKATDEKLVDSDTPILPILQRPSVTVAKLPFGFSYILIMKPSSEFLRRCEPNTDKSSILPALLVLGNLQAGAGIVPEVIPVSDTADEGEIKKVSEVDLEGTKENDGGQELKESSEEKKNSKEDTTGQSEDTSETIPIERKFPDEPEYFAIEFNSSERIQRVECLTKKDVVVESLIQLYDLQLDQFYKMVGVMTSEGSDKVSFCLAEDWILQLDYFTLRDKDHIENDFAGNCGYEGYWRPGYPDDMMSRINTFLDNFSKYVNKNK